MAFHPEALGRHIMGIRTICGSYASLALLLASQSAAGEPAPDCNKNGTPDSEDISAGLFPDGDGNGIPDECESRVRIVEVGPSEFVLAVEHSVPMLGFQVIVAYDSTV